MESKILIRLFLTNRLIIHCTTNKFETLILDHDLNFTLYFGTALKRLKSFRLAEIKEETTNLCILTLMNKVSNLI